MGGKETVEKLKAADPDVAAIVSSGYFEDPVMGNYLNFFLPHTSGGMEALPRRVESEKPALRLA